MKQKSSVEILTAALETAKAVDVEVVVIMKLPDDTWIEDRSQYMDAAAWIGRIEIAKQVWIAEYIKYIP